METFVSKKRPIISIWRKPFKEAAFQHERQCHYLIENLWIEALPKGEKRDSRQLLLCTSNLALNKMPRHEIILKERRQKNIGLPSNLTRRKRLFFWLRSGLGCHSVGRVERDREMSESERACCLPVAAACSFKKQISRRGFYPLSILCCVYNIVAVATSQTEKRESRKQSIVDQ